MPWIDVWKRVAFTNCVIATSRLYSHEQELGVGMVSRAISLVLVPRGSSAIIHSCDLANRRSNNQVTSEARSTDSRLWWWMPRRAYNQNAALAALGVNSRHQRRRQALHMGNAPEARRRNCSTWSKAISHLASTDPERRVKLKNTVQGRTCVFGLRH